MASVGGSRLSRHSHAAVGVGKKLYVWGGICDSNSIQASKVECLDVLSTKWEQRQLRGHPFPDRLDRMAVTSHGETGYLFGGRIGSGESQRSNTVYEVNMRSLECRELAPASASPAPRKKSTSGMVHYQHVLLVVYGGWTSEGRTTDELHLFDLNTNLWSVQATSGDRPPALGSLTLTKIDQHRAALFGGYDGSIHHNDTYILDMETWHWSKLTTSGKMPRGRRLHAACCIAGPLTGQTHPLLMVSGGLGAQSFKALSDVWILDVAQWSWSKQVALPTNRCGHSAVTFGTGPDFRVVVLFGGSGGFDEGSPISETTFLLMTLRKDCCKVEKVVGPGGLAAPDHKLREQMKRLKLSPQPQPKRQIGALTQQLQQATQRAAQAEARVRAIEGRVEEERVQRAEAEERARERGESLQEAEQRLRDLEWRVVEAEGNAGERGERVFWMVERKEIRLTQRELGRGAWAVVRVAEFRGLQVAAKCLHSIVISDYNRQLFVREMSIAAKLRHPNLVQFIGATLEGEPVILTELMTSSLRAVLEQGPLEPAHITSIARDVAHALNYLHLTRPDPILHRDVSSANVLLNPGPGGSWLAKLSDYGSANFTRLVRTTSPGNPSYAAPEGIVPSQQSPKMDVFSFGMLLAEMGTRRFPDKDALTAHIRQVTVPGLRDLIRLCTNDNPARRPNIRDVLTQL